MAKKNNSYKLTKTKFSYPYIIWMGIFIVVPLLLIFYYGLTVSSADGVKFSLENMKEVAQPIYLSVMWKSIVLAFYSTLICFILGYPIAVILASNRFVRKTSLLFLFILPMWMNMLLRTYSWMTILSKNGLLNTFLGWLNLPQTDILYTNTAVILGMVYNFLPFMVLPIYSVLCKMDKYVIEAAEDLGANAFTVFRKIKLPLSMPGIISGVVMVFMPAVSTFLIPRLLGGGNNLLIGNLIERQFVLVGDWHFGSALSLVMMGLILISMLVLMVYDPGHEKGGGLF